MYQFEEFTLEWYRGFRTRLIVILLNTVVLPCYRRHLTIIGVAGALAIHNVRRAVFAR